MEFANDRLENMVVNAFNNAVEEVSESGSDFVTIEVGGLPAVGVEPYKNDSFRFNLKELFKFFVTLEDGISTDDYLVDELKEDNAALSKTFTFYYWTLQPDSGAILKIDDPITRTYKIVRGVTQIEDSQYYLNRGLAFPLLKQKDGVSYVTLFKGYPFDITLYGEDINIDIYSHCSEYQFLAADLAADIDSVGFCFENNEGAHRLILSTGADMSLRINSKYYTMQLCESDFTIKLSVEDRCGVYMKWLNQSGGWDYYLFQPQREDELKDSDIGVIEDDFNNLWESDSRVRSMGKKATRTITLAALRVLNEELERIREIVVSPRVYLYTGKRYAAYSTDNWVQVQVQGKSTHITPTDLRGSIEIEVEMPQRYTITL